MTPDGVAVAPLVAMVIASSGLAFVAGMTFVLSTRPWCVCPKCRREWTGPR
jgi:hypothetical protein